MASFGCGTSGRGRKIIHPRCQVMNPVRACLPTHGGPVQAGSRGLTLALLITCGDREPANKKGGVGGRLEGRLKEEDEGRRFTIDSDEVSLRITGT